MWDSSNSNSEITSFQDELKKDLETNGSWDLDYTVICEKFNIIKCPFFTFGNSVCRIQNCIIDLPSWRCMLLAVPSSSSRTIEISVHNCQISAQHITDLADTILNSENGFKVMKLEYLKFVNEEIKLECLQALGPLFTSNIKLDFLSLRGNFFGDSLILENLNSFYANFTLKSLNLSNNRISDDGAIALFRVLRINTALIELSLSKNDISGAKSLEIFTSLLLGSVVTPEDDTIIKANIKVLTENNKKIKDLNKKRKKNGLADLPEILIPKKEQAQKVDGRSTLCNRNILVLDLSLNPLLQELISPFLDNIKKNCGSVSLVNAFGVCTLSLSLRSIPSVEIPSVVIPESDISNLSDVGIKILM
jgi:hypothetical protein